MAYTGTKGQTGNGLLLQISTGTPAWTTIGESLELTPSGYENKTDDGTNFQSTAVERVFTIKDGGTWDFQANRVSTDTGQAAVAAAFASGAATAFQIVLPKETGQTTTGDTYAFTAIVAKWNPAFKVDKITKIAGSLATTNGVTITEGA